MNRLIIELLYIKMIIKIIYQAALNYIKPANYYQI